MSEKAFSPNDVHKNTQAGYDRKKLIEQVNKALMDRPAQIKTGVWISVDVLDTDEATLKSILPDWDIELVPDSRDGDAWVIKEKAKRGSH